MKQSTLYSFCSALVVLVFTTGCATFLGETKKDCNGLTEEALGKRDGAIGDPRTRVSERELECRAAKASFNPRDYHWGEKEALQTYYCSPLHAINIGEQGGGYSGVCTPPPQLEERFLKFYRMGKRIREVREHIRAMDAQIETLRGEDWMHSTPYTQMHAHRNNPLVYQRLSELKDRRAAAIAELTQLEERVAILKQEEDGPPEPDSKTSSARLSPSSRSYTVPSVTETSPSLPYRQGTHKKVFDVNPPAYNQMSVIYDSASTGPQHEIKIDNSSTEYEAQSPDRDPFLLPRKNVMKEGTTLMIERDWYPN